MGEKEQELTQEELRSLRQWAIAEVNRRLQNYVGSINLTKEANELVDYILHGTIPTTKET